MAAPRRPRPPLRRRLRRPQPDPHARADREAARLPGGDRARDVDQGALPGGARVAPARRLRRRRPLPQADPAAGRVEFASAAEGDGDRTSRCATPSAAHRTSTAGSRRSRPRPRPDREERQSDDDHRHRDKGVAERSMGFGLRALNWLAGSDLLDRIRIRKAGRARPLPGHQERLPHGDRRRAHLQGRAAAGQTGAPDARASRRASSTSPPTTSSRCSRRRAAPSPRRRSARPRKAADDERDDAGRAARPGDRARRRRCSASRRSSAA